MSRKVAIVTGASRGIGASIALAMARADWDVVIAARSEGKLQEVLREIERTGVRALAVTTDLGVREQIEILFTRTLSELGRIDALVNNAVLSSSVDFLKMTPREWQEAMAVNLDAPVWCSQLAARQMVRQGSGVIINISSLMEKQSAGMNPSYVTAKGGLQALTRELAVRLGPAGVRVITVTPGNIDTGITESWAPDAAQWVAHFSDMTPLNRAGRPEEVADLIAFLCSEQAAYISGTEIVIDGARLAAIYPRSLTHKKVKDAD